MAGVEVEITGLDDVVSKLQRLANPRRTKSIARKAARQAMNIVRDAARNNAKAIDDPETSEKIFKNIKVSAGKTRNPNQIKMRVGVDGGAAMNANSDRDALAAKSGGNTTYWRFLEFSLTDSLDLSVMRTSHETSQEYLRVRY